jgi:starch synthase (maltosyl-transferring)
MDSRTISDENQREVKAEKWRHVVIEHVGPQVDGGRFPVKRVVGELMSVRAAVFSEGRDKLRAELLWRRG